jgi:hypothetical protein
MVKDSVEDYQQDAFHKAQNKFTTAVVLVY